VSLGIKYLALPSDEYDELQAAHPPNTKERASGQNYHHTTFAPALVSAVSVIPKMTGDEATELFTSKTWSGGETATLFVNALRCCNAGTDVPFNARD
jgi:hypothetical protein